MRIIDILRFGGEGGGLNSGISPDIYAKKAYKMILKYNKKLASRLPVYRDSPLGASRRADPVLQDKNTKTSPLTSV